MFLIEVQLICSFLLMSSAQQNYSYIYISYIYDIYIYTHTYILFQIIFPYRLLQDIEYSSLCYFIVPCCLCIVVCIC